MDEPSPMDKPLDKDQIMLGVCIIVTVIMIIMTATIFEDYDKTITNYNLCVDYSRGFAEYTGQNESWNRYVSDRMDKRVLEGVQR